MISSFSYSKNMLKVIYFLVYIIMFGHLNADVIIGNIYEINSKTPVDNVRIFLLNDSLIADLEVSDPLGAFIFDNVRVDPFYIKTMRYSYVDIKAGPFSFDKKDTLRLHIELESKPIEYEPVTKIEEGIDPQLERVGFYERKNKGAGYFLTKEDFSSQSLTHVSDIFSMFPGLVIGNDGTRSSMVSARYQNMSIQTHKITMNIYIDGAKVNMDFKEVEGFYKPLELNIIDPENIKAVEVYPSSASAPMQYGGLSSSTGGVVLIWTGRE